MLFPLRLDPGSRPTRRTAPPDTSGPSAIPGLRPGPMLTLPGLRCDAFHQPVEHLLRERTGGARRSTGSSVEEDRTRGAADGNVHVGIWGRRSSRDLRWRPSDTLFQIAGGCLHDCLPTSVDLVIMTLPDVWSARCGVRWFHPNRSRYSPCRRGSQPPGSTGQARIRRQCLLRRIAVRLWQLAARARRESFHAAIISGNSMDDLVNHANQLICM